MLKHFIRKITITVNQCFDVSNIILKIEVVYANVRVVMRELKILNISYAHSTVLDVMHLSVSSPSWGGGHRQGILTFSKKKNQNPHPRVKKYCQN